MRGGLGGNGQLSVRYRASLVVRRGRRGRVRRRIPSRPSSRRCWGWGTWERRVRSGFGPARPWGGGPVCPIFFERGGGPPPPPRARDYNGGGRFCWCLERARWG